MPTLAELRAQTGPKPRPKATRTVTLVEGQHLVDESAQIEEQIRDLLVSQELRPPADDDDAPGPPRKMGQKAVPDGVTALRDRQRAILAELQQFQAEVGLTGLLGGDWQRWKDEHPPREDNQADLRLTAGLCNSSDLFEALGQFVTSWDGDKLSEGDWSGWLADRIIYADRRDLVHDVVAMHEDSVTRVPKSLTDSSSTGTSETD